MKRGAVWTTFSVMVRLRGTVVPLGTKSEVVLHFIHDVVVHHRSELRMRFKVPFDGMGVEHLCDEAEGQNAR